MATTEVTPFTERSILILGGAGVNSIGRAAVDRFYLLGARAIYIGTTNEANFDRVIGEYKKQTLSTDRLHPFVANVTDKVAIAQAARGLKENGLGLTDVVFSHAGGLDEFMRTLINDYFTPIRAITGGRSLHRLQDDQQTAIRNIMGPMYERIKVRREQAIPHGIAVNFEGTFNALEVLGDEFPDGFKGIFINSTWGHLSGIPGVEIPFLYGPVDISKALVRDRLREDGQTLYEHGFAMAELVASLVRSTRIGKMFWDYLLPISDPEQAAAIKDSSINPEDVVEGIRRIIESAPNTWPKQPLELFVTGDKGQAVYGNHLDLSPMYRLPYPY